MTAVVMTVVANIQHLQKSVRILSQFTELPGERHLPCLHMSGTCDMSSHGMHADGPALTQQIFMQHFRKTLLLQLQ